MANASNDSRPRRLATRVAMMPRDTNGEGNIFGGVLLSNIDIAGAITAHAACPDLRTRMVTRAMDKVEFSKPVLLNDWLTCYGTVNFIGRTSIGVHIDAEVDRQGEIIPVTSADVVFVAIDDDGKPFPIPGGSDTNAANPSNSSSPTATGKSSNKPRRSTKPAEHHEGEYPRVLASQTVMMPTDLNGMGNVFGGILLSQMDLAGSYVARRVCKGRFIKSCATRVMDRVEFKKAVKLNDLITCYGTVIRIGRTSVTVHVEVEAYRGGQVIPVTSADLVFVALDEKGKPRAVGCKSFESTKDRIRARIRSRRKSRV